MVYWVNCNNCINIDTNLCDTCIHSEDPFLADHYERATPEMIAEHEAKERKKIEDSLCHEVIQLELAPGFINTFNKCKRFSSNDRPKYMPVEARKKSLASSNTYALCELYCDIHPELVGKNIVKIEGDKVYLAVREPYTTPDRKLKILPDDINRFFRHEKFISRPELKKIAERVADNRSGEEFVQLNIEDHSIILQAGFYDTALDILDDLIMLGYTGETSVVVFIEHSGRIAISPVLL